LLGFLTVSLLVASVVLLFLVQAVRSSILSRNATKSITHIACDGSTVVENYLFRLSTTLKGQLRKNGFDDKLVRRFDDGDRNVRRHVPSIKNAALNHDFAARANDRSVYGSMRGLRARKIHRANHSTHQRAGRSVDHSVVEVASGH
jgi:hypothetical protein